MGSSSHAPGGAVYVMADLSRRLHRSVPMDWMAVSSYGSGTKSSGVVRILKDLEVGLYNNWSLRKKSGYFRSARLVNTYSKRSGYIQQYFKK